jgi:hypothetical protein
LKFLFIHTINRKTNFKHYTPMAQIGNLTASASSVFNLDFLPERFLIATTDTDQPLSQISVVTSGTQLFSITAAARIRAVAKFDQGATLGADVKVPMWLKLSTGRINKQTTINVTNSGAGTESVEAVSTNISNIARRAVEQSINASANATFDTFEALFYDPTNVLRIQVIFANGYSDEYTKNEIDALYAAYHVADADGRLNGLSVIDSDSLGGQIAQVTIYNGSGGATVVLKTDYVQL